MAVFVRMLVVVLFLFPARGAFACDVVACVACKEGNKSPQVQVPPAIANQLPRVVKAQRLFNAHLTADGEQVLLFSTASDELDPLPVVALVSGERVVTTFEPRSKGGFTQLLATCEFALDAHRSALALAYRSGGNGSATMFLIIGYRDGKYQTLWSAEAPVSRIAVGESAGEFSLWEGEGSRECVWCPQTYRVTKYRFDGHAFERKRTIRIATKVQSSDIADVPLVTEVTRLD